MCLCFCFIVFVKLSFYLFILGEDCVLFLRCSLLGKGDVATHVGFWSAPIGSISFKKNNNGVTKADFHEDNIKHCIKLSKLQNICKRKYYVSVDKETKIEVANQSIPMSTIELPVFVYSEIKRTLSFYYNYHFLFVYLLRWISFHGIICSQIP